MALVRIDKIVSSAGNFSRKEARFLIKSGRVSVDGITVKSADEKYDPDEKSIFVDGMKLNFEMLHYFMMNKPAGYISSTDDPRDKTVLELVPEEYSRLKLFPAGRLDKDAEGLLILTDDGQYCHNVISPNKNVYKKYYVKVDGQLTKEDIEKFSEGMKMADGTEFLPGKLEILSENEGYVYIREGKFHQVKRMLAHIGKPVLYLKRVSIGNLELDPAIEKGKMKKISPEEAALVFGLKAQ